MDISIDMLSLGNGDSIIIWLKDHTSSLVFVIDGGNPDDGKKVINFLNKYILKHLEKSSPDVIISTHPDQDHIGGLKKVVEYYNNDISQVWVHNPSKHVDYKFFDSISSSLIGTTKNGEKKILESVNQLKDFISLVNKYNIQKIEPFFPLSLDGTVEILGPRKSFYEELLPSFDNMDDFLQQESKIEELLMQKDIGIKFAEGKSLSCKTVDEENSTSAENNSSAIIRVNAKNREYLFTGDAGVKAFEDVLEHQNLNDTYWLDIPHHGSRRSLTSEIIDHINPIKAFVSAEGDNKHPRQALINCLNKTDCDVFSTHKSGNLWHTNGDFPSRSDYSPANPV